MNHLFNWNVNLYLCNLYLYLWIYICACGWHCLYPLATVFLSYVKSASIAVCANLNLYLYLKSVFVFAQAVILPAGGMICILWHWSTPSWAQRSKDKWDRSTFPSMRSGYTRVTHLLKRRKKTGKRKIYKKKKVQTN